MIKALLFDVDGVLVNEEKKYVSRFLEEEFGIPHSTTRIFFEGEFLDCVEGKKDLKEMLPKYLNEWGWNVTVDEALRYWHTKEHIINEPLIQEMASFKEKGIKIFTATNQEVYRTNYIRNEMGFGDIFDEVISSSMLGARKPDAKYYTSILKRISFLPQETLFWDDSERNIIGANNVGLHAEQYQNFQHFKKVMQEQYNL